MIIRAQADFKVGWFLHFDAQHTHTQFVTRDKPRIASTHDFCWTLFALRLLGWLNHTYLPSVTALGHPGLDNPVSQHGGRHFTEAGYVRTL